MMNFNADDRQEYVLGFLFNEERSQVVLIEKTKPDWQAGYLNGVGGKIEPKDVNTNHITMVNAMYREFEEETGVQSRLDDWTHFATLDSQKWIVYCMKQFNTKAVDNVRTMTDERVVVVPLADLKNYKLLSNLTWMIPMCLDKNMGNPEFFAKITY